MSLTLPNEAAVAVGPYGRRDGATCNCCLLCESCWNGLCPSDHFYPAMSICQANVVFYLNLIPLTSGLGTIGTACHGSVKDGGYRCMIIMIGICQFLLTPCFLIGWCWAITHSMRLMQKAETLKMLEKSRYRKKR